MKRARFDDTRDESWCAAAATACRFADRGVFFFPGVFFFAEVRFLGDLAFDAFARSFLVEKIVVSGVCKRIADKNQLTYQ